VRLLKRVLGCDFARRRFDAPNGAGRLKAVSHLDSKIYVHDRTADLWVMIEEQIVTGTQSIVGFQEGPNLIECGLPRPGNAAARCAGEVLTTMSYFMGLLPSVSCA
jgi:hypothetical protein